jgi:muconate cycloisomerase
MPKISQIEVFKTDLPFKRSFRHSLKTRHASDSVFVKVSLDNGICGFGESLPRSYVTGNTRDSVFGELAAHAKSLIGTGFGDGPDAAAPAKDLGSIKGESRCALEIALLDALGKTLSRPVSAFLGDVVNKEFIYSIVISGGSVPAALAVSIFAKFNGYKFMKVKVGSGNDAARVGACRRVMPHSDIRVDANGAWDSAQSALNAIEALRRFRISCIEQPTPKGDMDALQEVADFCAEPVMADESLCTASDALELAQSRACDMFNVRLSKCGGIFNSLDIIAIARRNGIAYQIGCLVGESGVLSAAARHMAAVVPEIAYFEGSYARYLLKEDVIAEDLTPRRSRARVPAGAGLGVTVKEDVLRKYSTESTVIR